MYILQQKIKRVKDHMRSWAMTCGNPKHEMEIVSSKFHEAIFAIRSRCIANLVMHTIDKSGAQVTSLDEMKARVVSHFLDLFDCSPHPPPTIMVSFKCHISLELNAWLRNFPHEEEVMAALSISKDKAPDPNSILEDILQHHQRAIKSNILQATLFFFWQRYILYSINHTFMMLKLKKQGSTLQEDYRPIFYVNSPIHGNS